MTTTSGTKISYLHLCHRKLWLAGQGIRMENATNNAFVEEGKLIHETTYTRRTQKFKELNLGNLKIDHYDPRANIIREVKKSPKLEHAHIAQLKYYIYALELRGVSGTTGLLEYPKQRKTLTITLSPTDRIEIKQWEAEIERITNLTDCPDLVEKKYCRNCAYRDFCFV